jgi:RND superfamily putative drug exporter
MVEAAERVMDRTALPAGYALHLAGTEVEFYADMRIAFAAIPMLLVITLVIIFSLLGYGFKSALVPLRLSLTVIMPLVCVFGFAVLVYQDGVLNWTGIAALSSKNDKDGFFWYIPVICLLQAIGLCLDYDVFICARILEHRVDGYEIRAAIIKSVWEVNSTIVVAGLIMAAVFSGLLLGDGLSVNQFGFLLCTSVLVDTFIVQSILVPCIFSFGDGFLWWPRKIVSSGLISAFALAPPRLTWDCAALDDPEFSSG